jgi:undecaprenyl diphosphate synthase
MENSSSDEPQKAKPFAVGIIMDGNRRFAAEQGLSKLEGHRAGLEKVKEVVTWAQEAGIDELTFYTFSTENWNREKEELDYFLKLIDFAFDTWMNELAESGARVRIIGDRVLFSESLQKKFAYVEEKTKNGTKGTVIFALSYGGRDEILAAINTIVEKREADSATEVKKENKSTDERKVTADELRRAMWSAGLTDPQLIIRTSGEQRLSNFLTWQSAYSELAFTKTKWPALKKEEFDDILAEFKTRERRFGK